MSFDFTVKEFILGNGTGTPTFQFYRRGFNIGQQGETPSWQDIILHGNTALTLVNAKANGLNYLKLFGKCEQRNLPVGYTQYDYVTFNGTQEVDTGINISTNDEIRSKLQATSTGFAYGANTSNPRITLYMSPGGNQRWGTGVNNTSGVPPLNTMLTIIQNKTSITYNGNEYNFSETTDFTTIDTLTIGNCHGNTSTNKFSGDFCYMEIYQGGVLVAKMLPCTSPDNVVGFYDVVRDIFLAPTSGTLVAGINAAPTPDAPIDIVCNNGVLKYGFAYSSYNVARELSTTNYPVESQRAISYSDGVLTCTIEENPSGNRGLYPTWSLSFTANHKYGCIVKAKGDANINLGLSSINPSGSITGGESTGAFYQLSNDFVWYANIWDCNTTSTAIMNIRVRSTTIGKYASFSDILVVDLTEIFGAGNEPTTSAEVLQRTVKVYADGTTETVNIHTKNLFSGTVEQGGLSDSTGTENASSVRICATAVSVKPNTQYNLSWATNSEMAVNIRNAHFYTANNTWISRINASTFTTPPNTAFVRFVWQHSNPSVDIIPSDISNIQLELGSTATTYEPYFNGGSATAEMLLKVGTYQDEQSVLDGEVTRNIGVKVLDGTEDWAYSEPNTYGIANLTGTIAGKVDGNTNKLMCSHFGPQTSVWSSTSTEGILNGNNNNQVFFRVLGTRIASLIDWKTFLADQYAQGTPVIIVYPKSSATTETVTGQPLTIQAGTNIVEITQASIDNLELEVSYKGVV